jgi:hemerythrin superfamily protein
LRAYNAAGQGILEIQGIIFKQVSNQFSLKESKQVYFYQPTWLKQTLSPQKRDFENRHAIIFDHPKATQLRQEIAQCYQEYLIIKPLDDYIKILHERLTQVNKECDIYYL